MSYRVSNLQRRIVGALANKPIATQVELAQLVNSHQPSVSRSLDSLFDRGLVVKHNGFYQLTEAGRAMAENQQLERAQFQEFSHSITLRIRVASASLRMLADELDALAVKIGCRDDS